MDFTRLKLILAITVLVMVAHTIEEYVTQLWNFDPFIIAFSQYFQLNPAIVYLVIQVLALLLIFTVLMLAFRDVFNKFLGIVLGLVFLLELLHPYNSIIQGGYYPGLYSGMLLVIVGYFYWKELIKYLR